MEKYFKINKASFYANLVIRPAEYEPGHEKTNNVVVWTNRTVQAQKMARDWKVWV